MSGLWAWQPIETAPKDGTEILVWFDCATVPVVHIAWYRGKEEWESSGQYCGGWDSLEDFEGWWSYTTGSVSQEKLEGYRMPTRWMIYEARAEYFEEKYRQEVFLRSTYELTARNAALEEALAVVDSYQVCGSVADEIRALKEGAQE